MKIKEMETEKLISLLCGDQFMNTKALPEYDIPSLEMSDGPMGLRYQKKDKDSLGINRSEPATCLPAGVAVAAYWNPDVAEQVGTIIGSEAAAYGVDLVLGPAGNLERNPLCGRNVEYLSEDPLLAGRLGGAYIRGVQSQQVGACIKHFAANNQETEREYLNVICEEDVLRDLYLKAFEIAIREGKPAAVMTSLSKINGTYCAENRWLFDILRKEWGFDGLVMTDWFGLDDRVKSAEAGLDLEMPGTDGKSTAYMVEQWKQGRLDEHVIRERAECIIRNARKWKIPKTKKTEEERELLLKENHEKVCAAAEEAIVLLKNKEDILPLQQGRKLAVIGEYAREPLFQAEGSGKVEGAGKEDAWECAEKWNGADNTPFAMGYRRNNAGSEAEQQKLRDEAVKTAADADAVLFFLAMDFGFEGEGNDRVQYELPEYQVALLKEIAAVNSNVIAVVMNGGAVAMPWADEVKAILECFYGGQGIGRAIVKVISGEVNPSGHMPVSVPAFREQIISDENFAEQTEQVTYREGMFMGYRGYETKKIPVQFPFGFGLSYTTFEITECSVEQEKITDCEKTVLRGKIRNTGNRKGAQVVQLYVKNPRAWKARPARELRDFQKIILEAGEEKDEKGVLLKGLDENSELSLEQFDSKQHFTQPPAHYTEASLVKTLEELGIGRPSTYAPTITLIINRRYVAKENKNLYMTELGEVVNNIMMHSFPSIVDVSFTANMESLLDGVAEGKVRWKTIIENFYPDLDAAVKKAEEELEEVKIEDEVTDVICEECGRNMVIKYGPHGKFLACPGFPECRNTKPYLEKIGVKCPMCGKDVVIRKTKKGRRYYGCENNPECEFMSWQKPSEKKCPQCGNYMVEKGNKLVCADEQCGYVMEKPESSEE